MWLNLVSSYPDGCGRMSEVDTITWWCKVLIILSKKPSRQIELLSLQKVKKFSCCCWKKLQKVDKSFEMSRSFSEEHAQLKCKSGATRPFCLFWFAYGDHSRASRKVWSRFSTAWCLGRGHELPRTNFNFSFSWCASVYLFLLFFLLLD